MEKINSFRAEMLSKARTAGDGMESAEYALENTLKVELKQNGPSTITDSLLPGRLIQVYPSKIVTSEKKTSHVYSKSPKFVPYEPYPGAVKPIASQAMSKNTKKSRNNMDINTLISQMSQMDTNLNEFKPRPKLASVSDKSTTDNEKDDIHNDLMKKLQDSLQENETLKEQLKQQVQVNKELKTMLVASMGEDLETQVQSLNEDKKHLANALLSSAQHLSTHQVASQLLYDKSGMLEIPKVNNLVKLFLTQNEQTEWLAGQCEVWRSKFLASSLMVEELANCKKLLIEKTVKLQQAIKQLLDERYRTRDMMLCTYRNMYSLHEKWLENIAISEYMGNNKIYSRPIGNLNFTATLPHSTNILDIASVNLKLSENVSSSLEKQDISHFHILPSTTEAELFAENVMAMPLEVRKENEDPVNALVNHAYNNSTNMSPPVASCVHCNGRVQLL